MEVFTLKEWEENFDKLYERVENGETIGIVKEDGTAAVMMPAEDDLIRIYREENSESFSNLRECCLLVKASAYNGVNRV